MSVVVQECSGCRRKFFPRRLLCGDCDSAAFRDLVVADAVVEEFTHVSGGRCLGSIRLLGEITAMAALIGIEPERGMSIPVRASDAEASSGYAFIPGIAASEAFERTTQ
ncbi:hypothetical protein [Salinibacterium sp. GXW1014]|uniref:hypothetical protein n=1 Tax=Salinibacterium sp. GXW1014 TaxID=3377838 RepID=UPI00383B3BC9